MSEAKRKVNHVFAGALCKARGAYALTQEDTAELIGVSPRWYQKIEAGTGTPNLRHTVHLMALFRLDPQVLAEEAGLYLPPRAEEAAPDKLSV